MFTTLVDGAFTLFSLVQLPINIPVAAYIDPATTSYIIQIIAGLFISLSLGFTLFTSKFKAKLLNIRIHFMQRKVLSEAKRKANERGHKLTALERKQIKKSFSSSKHAEASNLKSSNMDLLRRYELIDAIDDGQTRQQYTPVKTEEKDDIAPSTVQPKTRLAYLFYDTRSFKQRYLYTLLTVFAIVFTVFIFGILDLYATNSSYYPFLFTDLIGPVLLFSLPATVLLSLLISSIRGRLFDLILSLVFGLHLVFYIQGNFLNLDLGQLTGDSIPWNDYSAHAIKNLIVCLCILLIPFVIRYFKPKLWRNVLTYLSLILIVMQAIALINSFANNKILSEQHQGRYLSTRGMLEMGTDENIIVILLDRFDQRYIEDMLKEDPSFYDDLDGFTRFTNNVTAYCRTYPAAAHLVTGKLSHYEMPADRYFRLAWQGSSFYPDLKEAAYETKLYMASPYLYTDISQLEGIADNIDEEDISIDHKDMLIKMFTLSSFRYAPHALKANFHIGSNDFSSVVHTEKSNTNALPYRTDDAFVMDLLEEEGLSIGEHKKNYIYLHLNGMHDFILDEDANKLPEGEKGSQSMQMKASFNIVRTYLNQLKELGLYDNSTIVITGDHGKSKDYYALDYAITTGLFVKPKGASNPLMLNNAPVSSEMFLSTLIQEAGLAPDGYGKGYFDVKEDDELLRYSYYRVYDRDSKRNYVEKFAITGDARDFANWDKVDEFKIQHVHG